MIIDINPYNLSAENAEKLRVFFDAQMQQGIHIWKKGVKYLSPDGETQFSFPCDVVERKRKNNKEGSRFEFISNDKSALVGEGSYGKVYKVMGTLAFKEEKCEFHEAGYKGRTRVIKIQAHDENNPLENALKEYELANEASHLGVKKPTHINQSSYSVMKMMPGKDLIEIIAEDLNPETANLTLQQRYDLTVALLTALKEQVTDKKIIHRDLKGENIRVDLSTNPISVNIFDFGLSSHSDPNAPDAPFNGSFTYVAPEVVNSDNKQTPKADVFSMARIIALLWHTNLESYNPELYAPPYLFTVKYKDEEYEYDDEEFNEEQANVEQIEVVQVEEEKVEQEDEEEQVEVDISELFDGLDNMDPECKQTIKTTLGQMLQIDPEKRFSVDEAINSFQTIKNLVKEPGPILNSNEILEQAIKQSKEPMTALLIRIKEIISRLDNLEDKEDCTTQIYECMDLAMKIANPPAHDSDEKVISQADYKEQMVYGRANEKITLLEKEVQDLESRNSIDLSQ